MQRQGRPTEFLGAVVRVLVSAFGMIFPAFGSAELESIRFEHFGVNEGLSQSSVHSILQDRRGYLWVGTQDGLNRFDGYQFVIKRNDPDDPRSLANSNISSIFEDSDGVMWIGTTSGTLHRYVPESDDFERIAAPKLNAPNGRNQRAVNIRDIFETRDGQFWIGTDLLGVFLFRRGSNEFVQLAALDGEIVNVLEETQSGELWVGTSRGLTRFEVSAGRLDPLNGSDARPLNEEVRAIVLLRSGEVWAAGGSGLISRFAQDGTLLGRVSLRPSGASNVAIRSLLEDSNGRIWVALIGGGVQVLTGSGELIAALAHSPRDRYTLNTDTAYALLEDRAGVLWVGTLEAGLSKSVLGSGRFTHLRHVPGDPTSLGGNMVIEFAEDEEGGIWVGSDGGGLSYLMPGSVRFRNLRADPAHPASLSSDRVWGLYLEPGGPLWVGTWGGGLNRLDRQTGVAKRFLPDGQEGSISGSNVIAIVTDGAGGIFAGLVDGGLVHLAAGDERFRRLALFDQAEEQQRPLDLAALYHDSQGRLWVGTWRSGLCVAESFVQQFDCYTHNDEHKRSINDNNIRAVTEDEAGEIWVATGNGIARFDEESRDFDRFTAADGLVPGVIYSIVPEGDGVLWLSSNHGLMRFNTRTREARHYEYRDGLQANEFNGGSALKARSGDIFFGGVGGITRFRPTDLADNPLPPTVVITDFSLFNKSVDFRRGGATTVLSKPASETSSIALKHDQNFIGFEFAGLHFVSPSRNRYAYMLEGLDQDWTETDARRRFASYANLAPGDYVFRVRAANSDGVWSTEDAAISIHIAPPWWLTWWAKSLWVFAAAMLLFIFIQWRLSMLRIQTKQLAEEVEKRTAQVVAQKDTIERQAAHLEDALESKSRFFARLSHEFRTPITLILGPIDESLREAIPEAAKRSLAIAKRNGKRLLHLVDQLLTLARHGGKQHVERRPIALMALARVVVAEFDSATAQNGIALTLDVAEEVWVESNADALQTILINLISNSLKYTEPGGRIVVSIGREGGDAVLRVTDTGVGIAAQYLDSVFNLFERGAAVGPGTGIGLTLVKELIDAHEGFIGVESAPGSGTTVTVRMKAVPSRQEASATTVTVQGIDTQDYVQDSATTVIALPEAEDGRPEVLIIDDNDDMRQFIVDLLQRNYACIEARDGASGLATAIERIPDAIICDVMMPGIDGFEALQRLRGDEHTSHIPIIMLTARGDEASRLKGLRERADDYLAKPFLPDELRYRLRNLLELNQLRAERARQHLLAGSGQPSGVAEAPGLTKRDQAFVDRLAQAMSQNFQNAEFHANDLAVAMHMSHRQLQRKLKSLLDVVPATCLRDFRLQKARAMLENGASVTNVAMDCGFSSAGYFTRCFAARYGIRPSEILNR